MHIFLYTFLRVLLNTIDFIVYLVIFLCLIMFFAIGKDSENLRMTVLGMFAGLVFLHKIVRGIIIVRLKKSLDKASPVNDKYLHPNTLVFIWNMLRFSFNPEIKSVYENGAHVFDSLGHFNDKSMDSFDEIEKMDLFNYEVLQTSKFIASFYRPFILHQVVPATIKVLRQYWNSFTLTKIKHPNYSAHSEYLSLSFMFLKKLSIQLDTEKKYSQKLMTVKSNIEDIMQITMKYDKNDISKYSDDINGKLKNFTKLKKNLEIILGLLSFYKDSSILKYKLLFLRRQYSLCMDQLVLISSLSEKNISELIDCVNKDYENILALYSSFERKVTKKAFERIDPLLEYQEQAKTETLFRKSLEQTKKLIKSDVDTIKKYHKKASIFLDMYRIKKMNAADFEKEVTEAADILGTHIKCNTLLENMDFSFENTDIKLDRFMDSNDLEVFSDKITEELSILNIEDIKDELSTAVNAVEEIDELYNLG